MYIVYSVHNYDLLSANESGTCKLIKERAQKKNTKKNMTEITESLKASAIWIHDIFNIITLSCVSILTFIYLIKYTQLELIGTNSKMATNGHEDFIIIYYLFSTYLLVDMIWIIVIPYSVASKNSSAIIFHHLVTAGLVSLPMFDSRYEWHMVLSLVVEANTVFLALRRNTSIGSITHKISDILFYITWLFLRLLLFPLLCVLFTYEWYYRYLNTYILFNIILLAPILMACLTAMSVFWTVEIYIKTYRRKPKDKSGSGSKNE